MPQSEAPSFWHRHLLAVILSCCALLVLVIIVIQLFDQGDLQNWLQNQSDGWVYVTIFAMVALDAVVPIFPGETTLSAASTLVTNGNLSLELVMLFGALGSIIGDSALFWIARTNSVRAKPQLEKALTNPTVNTGWEMLQSSPGLLIVGGRYVPGMRFAVNASMGLFEIRYRRFLVWSIVGGVLWSVYTCALAYKVATALAGYPLASLVISGLVTSAVIVVMFLVYRKKHRAKPDAGSLIKGSPTA